MAKHKIRNGAMAALDIGSSKVVCLIARARDEETPRILGIGHQASRGMKNGVVVDMDALELSIRAAVDAAEQMAGERISDVIINITGAKPSSSIIKVDTDLKGQSVTEHDIDRLIDYARRHAFGPDRTVLHALPISYAIDGASGIRDPKGMSGENLEMSIHIVGVSSGLLHNLASAVQRGMLDIEECVASSYAAGLSTLVEDEKDLGVTVIDMGGGTTSLAVFHGGEMIHTGCLPVGGGHVTNDIAYGLSTSVASAERLKTLHGSALPSPSDEREILKVPLVGEEDQGADNPVPRSMLVQLIQPRIEETFELVRDHLEKHHLGKIAGRRIVLTGGASQLQGVRDLAVLILEKQVRLGRPNGFPHAASSPAFAAATGLLLHGLSIKRDIPEPIAVQGGEDLGMVGKIGHWLKRNF